MMGPRKLLRESVIVCLLAGLALSAGCAKPSAPPAQFIGTWIAPPPGTAPKVGAFPTLTLNPDGTGVFTLYPDPHTQNISWVLRGGAFIMADRDGSGSVTYSYRFKGPDELTLSMKEGGTTFKRYQEASPAAAPTGPSKPASGQPSTGEAPTTGGSARPPARSRR